MMLYIATRGNYSCDVLTARSAEHFTVAGILHILEVFTNAEGDMSKLPSGAKLYAEMALVKVCDPSLDESISSLIARVSALEEGTVKAPPSPAEPERRSPTPVKSEKSNKISSAAENGTLLKKAGAAPSEDNKNAQKSVRNWAEIIRKAEQKDISVGSFLKETFAFTDDSERLYIKCPNEFAKDMLSTDERRALIASVAGPVLGRTVTPANIIFSKAEANEKRMPINDLIDTEDN